MLSQKYYKIHREMVMLEFFSNTAKDFQAVRFTTLSKRDPLTGISETDVRRRSTKGRIHKINR